MHSSKGIWISLMVLVMLTAAVYLRVGSHEFLNYDDDVYVTANPHVAEGITGPNIVWAFTTLQVSNWHPVTWLSHMADAQLYGLNPRGHHLTSVLIHTVSALLLFLLLFHLTNSPWQSTFVAALFALHPMHVESVAWVAERKDVLSALFWFLTLLAYAEYVAKRKPALYLLALVFFVLGLMSKPMLVTLPVIMLMMDFWPLNRFRPEGLEPGRSPSTGGASKLKDLLKEKIPFFVCSLVSAAVTIYAQRHGGAIRSLDDIPFALRIGNAVIAYVKYIIKTVWPHDLAILYPFPATIPSWQVICSLLVLLLVSAATVRAGRNYPYLAVGWLWFLVTLVPVIGLIQVGGQSMADRYSYIPQIGLFIMAAWGVPVLFNGTRHRQVILALLAGAAIIASTVSTWHQLGYWRDSISLFRHALQVTTGNSIAHNNLGNALTQKGEPDAAIREYLEALTINPNYFEAHNNLGVALLKNGNMGAAIQEFREAVRINPDYFRAHNNLGMALANIGNLDAAIQEFREALRINPDYINAQNNLGNALAAKRGFDGAGK
jgi:hypothetical protein